MANKITQEQIIEMNKLYLKIKTYAGVARKIGVSPGTVKKYIIPDFVDPQSIEIIEFKEELPAFVPESCPKENWSEWIKLSDREKEEIEELWKELVI